MSIVDFKIIINGDAKGKNRYSYKYNNIKERIYMCIEHQQVTISYKYNTNKVIDINDIVTFKERVAGDAILKAYYVHALKFDEGLVIDSITASINDQQKTVTPASDTTELFPFTYSMLKPGALGLKPSWNNIISPTLDSTITDRDEDKRFAAVSAYLLSKSREFEIDKFSNLWTAMNSLYSYMAEQYCVRAEQDIPGKELTQKMTIKKEEECVGLLSWFIHPMHPAFNDEYRKVEKEVFTENSEHMKIDALFRGYGLGNVEEIYNATINELNGVPLPEEYKEIGAYAERIGMKTFPFILLQYSYYWRCKYFHGNVPTLLFLKHNDLRYSSLLYINYFLDRFLNEHIPQLFVKEYWDESKHEIAKAYVSHVKGKSYDDMVRDALANGKNKQ